MINNSVKLSQNALNNIKTMNFKSALNQRAITNEDAKKIIAKTPHTGANGVDLSPSGLKLATSSFISVERFKFTFDNSQNLVKDIADKYSEYRNKIIEVTENDVNYKDKKEELLANLDKQYDNLVNHYSNEYIKLITELEDKFSSDSKSTLVNKDKMNIEINLNRLSSDEKYKIKKDYIEIFNNARNYVKENGTSDGLDNKIMTGKSKTINSDDINQIKSKTSEMISYMLDRAITRVVLKSNKNKVSPKMYETGISALNREIAKQDNKINQMEGSEFLKKVFYNFLNSKMI